eukprot:23091_1
MGLSDSKEQAPVPELSIINEQKLEWGTCYCGYTGRVIPSWIPHNINSELSHLGFTEQTLIHEIEKINEIAAQFVNARSNACRCYWWLGFVIASLIMIVGLALILIINPSYLFVLFGCAGGAILIVYLFNWGVTSYYLKIWNQCLEYIEQDYIRNQLNPRYNAQNIFWSVRWKKVRHGCGKSSYFVKYIDIVISPGSPSSTYNPPQTNPIRDNETAHAFDHPARNV